MLNVNLDPETLKHISSHGNNLIMCIWKSRGSRLTCLVAPVRTHSPLPSQTPALFSCHSDRHHLRHVYRCCRKKDNYSLPNIENINSGGKCYNLLKDLTCDWHHDPTSGGWCCLRWGHHFLWAWPYFYNSILNDCHSYPIHPVQCNINRFRLLLEFSLYLWGCFNLAMNERLQCRCTVANESFYWTNSGMFIPVWFRLRNVFQQNRQNEYTPDQTQTVHFHSFFYSFSHLPTLFLSPFPFACGLQCTTHQLSVTRGDMSKLNLHIISNTYSLHCFHHIS